MDWALRRTGAVGHREARNTSFECLWREALVRRTELALSEGDDALCARTDEQIRLVQKRFPPALFDPDTIEDVSNRIQQLRLERQ